MSNGANDQGTAVAVYSGTGSPGLIVPFNSQSKCGSTETA